MYTFHFAISVMDIFLGIQTAALLVTLLISWHTPVLGGIARNIFEGCAYVQLVPYLIM